MLFSHQTHTLSDSEAKVFLLPLQLRGSSHCRTTVSESRSDPIDTVGVTVCHCIPGTSHPFGQTGIHPTKNLQEVKTETKLVS